MFTSGIDGLSRLKPGSFRKEKARLLSGLPGFVWVRLSSACLWVSVPVSARMWPPGSESWPVTAWSRHRVPGSLSGPAVESPPAQARVSLDWAPMLRLPRLPRLAW